MRNSQEVSPQEMISRFGGKTRRGYPNKLSDDIKKMVITALHYVGGVDYLMRQAEANPVAFLGLVGRVLPLQVTGEGGGKLQVEFKWADSPTEAATAPLITAESAMVEGDAVVGDAVTVTWAAEAAD